MTNASTEYLNRATPFSTSGTHYWMKVITARSKEMIHKKILNTKQVPMYPQPDPYTIFWCRTPRSWVVHHSRLQETRLHFRSSDIIWPFPPWQACFGLPNGCQEAAKQRSSARHSSWVTQGLLTWSDCRHYLETGNVLTAKESGARDWRIPKARRTRLKDTKAGRKRLKDTKAGRRRVG